MLLLHHSWFMRPEDLAPYFLLYACLPKDNFFTTSSLLLENETIGSFCLRKQQTMLSWTLRCNCSVKNPYYEWQTCSLLASFVFPGKGGIHPEMNLLPRAWIWCLLCWENAAAWSTHISLSFRHPRGMWNVGSKQVFPSMVLSILFGVGLAGYVERWDSAPTPRICLAHRRFLPSYWLRKMPESKWV